MSAAFASYLDQNPGIEAIFVGTRRTDPHGGALGFFDRTDGGWPAFMRCHPVIDWHYVEIWSVSLLDFVLSSVFFRRPQGRGGARWEGGRFWTDLWGIGGEIVFEAFGSGVLRAL